MDGRKICEGSTLRVAASSHNKIREDRIADGWPWEREKSEDNENSRERKNEATFREEEYSEQICSPLSKNC